MTDLQDALQEVSDLLYDKMHSLLPPVVQGRIGESRLAEAMRYSALSRGKRLRPFLLVASAELFGVGRSAALQAAAAIEFIHTYSLIHDDLPCMDDDDMRRGKPSCHKAFDESTAILAGDALQALAFEILADSSTHADTKVRVDLIQEVAKASGARGLVGGQIMDLMSEDKDVKLNTEEVTRLQRMKTGALFVTSCEAGAILGKAPIQLRNALRGYANNIGLAFQIRDDLLDAKDEDIERINKSSGKATLVSALGADKARMQAQMLCEQAVSHLEVFDKRACLLKELANFIVKRKH